MPLHLVDDFATVEADSVLDIFEAHLAQARLVRDLFLSSILDERRIDLFCDLDLLG